MAHRPSATIFVRPEPDVGHQSGKDHADSELAQKGAAKRTLEFARRIATVPTMAALLVKESVNQTVDNMGFHNALQACFTLHQLNHSHWAELNEDFPLATVKDGVGDWRSAPAIQPARRDVP